MALGKLTYAGSLFIAVGLLGVARLALGTKPEGVSVTGTPAMRGPRDVRAATIERAPMDHPIHTSGLLRAKKELDLGFLLGGEVTWVGVDVGAHVKKGQVLARIDTTAIAADADRARAAREKAVRDFGRVQTLANSGTLPQNDLDDAKTGTKVADATVRSADFALAHGVIVAPEDGIIDARTADPHEVVAGGQPIFRMSGASQGTIVRVGLTDKDVLGLQLGTVARVTIDARPGDALSAKVTQIASASSPMTGTFEVELRLDDAMELGNGLSAKVEIARTAKVASTVPIAALVDGDGSAAFVFVVDGGVAHRRSVHVAFFEKDRAALIEPLGSDTRVATIGAGSLTEGDHVKEQP